MTHTTDQDRVSLPLDLVNDLLALCTPEDHELRDRVKQAARRAQVVPQVEVTDYMAIAFHNAVTDGPIGEDDFNDIKTGLHAALAAAHQPPEAACNPSMQPELATEAAAEHKALRSVYEAARGLLRYEGVDDGRAITYRTKLASVIEEVKHIDSGLWEPPEAAQLDDIDVVDMAQAVDSTEPAPVQMPEPVAFKVCDKNEPDIGFWLSEERGAYWQTTEPLYTEHQVCQLLAAQQFTLDELAMLTRKLVQQLRKASPGNESAEKALDYLKRKGLAGNPLRTTQEPST